MIMDIGRKIKDARTNCNLTQEQAAEALGVSRQTISNWENSKSYPDIVSVIKMSDLYSVSLDYLLKGEDSMSNYMDYLEESTNIVKSRNQLSKVVQITAYLVIWIALVILFWLSIAAGGGAKQISVIANFIVLPLVTLAITVRIGRDDDRVNLGWLISLFFGAMFFLYDLSTIYMANYRDGGEVSGITPTFVCGTGLSLLGIGLGIASKHVNVNISIRQKKNGEQSAGVEKHKKKAQVLTYFGLCAIIIAAYWIIIAAKNIICLSEGLHIPDKFEPFSADKITLAVSFVASIIAGSNKDWKRFKWLTPLIFGAMITLSHFMTWDFRMMINSYKSGSFKLVLPASMLTPIGILLCLFGVSIGYIINLNKAIKNMGDEMDYISNEMDKGNVENIR